MDAERAGSSADSVGGAAEGAAAAAARARELVPRARLDALVDAWLAEDCPGFDYGGAVVGSRRASASLYVKQAGVVAGAPFFEAVFARLGCAVAWAPGAGDGLAADVRPGGRLRAARVSGPAAALLQGERVALNALAECSGVATAAARAGAKAKAAGWRGALAGTRKTTPGFRLVQKYGMVVGGVDAHRMDLSSMVMLKDNHVAAAGGIAHAVRAAKDVAGFALKIDVECASLDDALCAAKAGADVVMLDNFAAADFRRAARAVRDAYPHVLIEGSGGLDEHSMFDYFCDEADVLSFSINRHATALDMSLKIDEAADTDF